MKIGILGSTGFVGINLVSRLKINNIEFVEGSRRLSVDARSLDSVVKWINENSITHIINLAALCGGIGANKNSPADFWLDTTLIYAATLKACQITNIKKVVNIGTVCMYAANCPTPFKEEYIMHYGMPEETNMAYGIAKLNALVGAQAFTKQYNLKTVNLIPVNTYGPHDNFDLENSHVIPAMIRKFIDSKLNNNNIVLWGDGTPTREFIFVDDLVDAIIQALNHETPEFINIGSGNEVSMKSLAETIAKLTNYSGKISWDNSRPNGQMKRQLNIERANKELNFYPQIKLDDGLLRTIKWYIKKNEINI